MKFNGSVYGLPLRENEFTGTLDIHPRGFAYVHTTDEKKLFLNPENLKNACHGDTVTCVIVRKGRDERHDEARVIRIVKRGRNEFVCVYHHVRNYDLAIPEGHHCREDIILEDMNGFKPKEGDYILAEITRWRVAGQRHLGRVVRLIGTRNNLEFDAILVANQYGINNKFSADTLSQVEQMEFSIPDDPLRVDLRDKELFTIDPADAKDFDDAMSMEKTKDGNWELGIHIADVSQYVPYETAVDRDALMRGTSVYFTDCVIPMLPEKLSNDLCSLKPNVDRLAMTALITVTENGKVLSTKIMPSVIHSCRRFTYEEAQAVLDKNAGDYVDTLKNMSRIAAVLKKNRYANGSIDFDLPEPIFTLNNKGIPTKIEAKEHLWTHQIVEEFMLIANQEVARFMRTRGTKIPFIFRVHEEPDQDHVEDWFLTMSDMGIKLPKPASPLTPKSFQVALETALKHDQSEYIKRLALRTMSKAKYSTNPKGHFGLAFDDYTHFTSPIRRYPDLMVHRLLKYEFAGKKAPQEMQIRLNYIAKQSTDCEIKAMESEREYHKIKSMRFIQNAIGEVFTGRISGVARHGFWVAINDIFVEGFVPVRTLPNDVWDFSKRHHSMKGLRSGTTYRMSDQVTIRVIKVDVEHAQADFEIVEKK